MRVSVSRVVSAMAAGGDGLWVRSASEKEGRMVKAVRRNVSPGILCDF